MELRLNIDGATVEELARGVAAVFARAGITALQGAEGVFALGNFDGSLLMANPPANPAIALTLAMMRGQAMHFE